MALAVGAALILVGGTALLLGCARGEAPVCSAFLFERDQRDPESQPPVVLYLVVLGTTLWYGGKWLRSVIRGAKRPPHDPAD